MMLRSAPSKHDGVTYAKIGVCTCMSPYTPKKYSAGQKKPRKIVIQSDKSVTETKYSLVISIMHQLTAEIHVTEIDRRT